MSPPSPFKTPEGKATFLAAYDAALKLWPVPYEELDIPTRFGLTHVVAAGPKNAPALVLLHGYMATSVMWAPNVADFSRDYRVYAIDIMGQPSKSVPGDPIRDANRLCRVVDRHTRWPRSRSRFARRHVVRRMDCAAVRSGRA